MEILQSFKAYLVENKKSSSSTIDAYVRDVKQFLLICTQTDFSKIDTKVIENYISNIDKSESTKIRILASLRAFFKYLMVEGITNNNPTESIKFKKAKPKALGILDSNEVLLLLSQPDTDDLKGLRDKAMLELLYATGIKVSELLQVKLSDINLTIGILHLKNANKERIVPIYPAALKTIMQYIENVRPAFVTDDNQDILFSNIGGQPMSRQGFWKIIKFYAKKAGIKGEITPQTLRHSFAAHLLENGAKLQDIKEMLGHSDISSTQIYAQFVKEKYASKYEKFHPLAK